MIDIIVPLEQEGAKVVVRAWLKKIGDRIAENDPVVELETDKVAQEVSAPADGVLAEILLDTDAEAAPGSILGRLEPAGPADSPAEAAKAEHRHQNKTPAPQDVSLSPAVRHALREHHIDPASIVGTGRGGRITRADVDRAVRLRQPVLGSFSEEGGYGGQVADSPPRSRGGGTISPSPGRARVVQHDRMRRTIAENMLNSVATAPHVTAMFEADLSAITSHRRNHRQEFEKANVNLTFTAYFVAGAAAAMRVVPEINSRWYDDRLEIFDDINIGIATALGDKGLIVPVIHEAQKLSLGEIAAKLADLTARARSNSLTTADVRGGTFTISNHGVSGSLFAAPIIIPQPQSAILGIGKLEKRVVVREVEGVDTIQIRPMAYVSLTIDHRVVDAHQTNAWLSKFVETLESWPAD
jgi:2-oxoglutarate dehydrogenase E2 component (dihydrolipoamide succinyltransferase)